MKHNSKHSKKEEKTNKNNFSEKLFILFIFIIILLLIFIIYKSIKNNNNTLNNFDEKSVTNIENVSKAEKNKDRTINLTVLGDIMCHSTNFADAYNKSTKNYDFNYVFSDISSSLSNSDLTIGNLETTFAGAEKGYNGYPCFNTPENLGLTLKNNGVDILTTANNHSLDTGYTGLVSTLNFLDQYGIAHTGTARNEEEQNSILIKNVNGIKIAFLSYTYGTNGNIIPNGKEYCINLINKDLITKQINLAKEQNVDLICASMHWGTEYQTKENKEQDELADFLFQNGVDVILGSHAHVLEPMQKKTITLPDGTNKDVFVIYSLGNFMSGQTFPNTQDSILLNISITKNSNNETKIGDITYKPIYMQYIRTSSPKYKILDIQKTINDYETNSNSNISKNTYITLKKELEQIKTIVGPEYITSNSNINTEIQ